MVTDFAQQLADMQAAMRALWPDRPVVYFTESSDQAMGPGPVLTDEEQNLLRRVANAITEARDGAPGELTELRAVKARLEERINSLGLDAHVYGRELRMLDEIAGDS